MRSLVRNQRLVHYALYRGETPAFDDSGFETGERVPQYDDPKPLWINVSPEKGMSQVWVFGNSADYDHVLVTCDMGAEIDEQSRLWINIPIDQPHNYIVKRVARSLNGIAYAVRKVNAGE